MLLLSQTGKLEALEEFIARREREIPATVS